MYFWEATYQSIRGLDKNTNPNKNKNQNRNLNEYLFFLRNDVIVAMRIVKRETGVHFAVAVHPLFFVDVVGQDKTIIAQSTLVSIVHVIYLVGDDDIWPLALLLLF